MSYTCNCKGTAHDPSCQVKPAAIGYIPNIHDPDRTQILADEIEALKLKVDRYEQGNLKCNKGHVNALPLRLWDCPMCTEELKQRLTDTEVILWEANKKSQERREALELVLLWFEAIEPIREKLLHPFPTGLIEMIKELVKEG